MYAAAILSKKATHMGGVGSREASPLKRQVETVVRGFCWHELRFQVN